ncbi:MAG TPA: hypothetical protein VKP30_10220 [Polyangiaceae bacterium]|nr:hypothetical protein [Polyangiaceae bacterium]
MGTKKHAETSDVGLTPWINKYDEPVFSMGTLPPRCAKNGAFNESFRDLPWLSNAGAARIDRLTEVPRG